MAPLGNLPDIHSPRYEIRGECNRCGICCELEGCEHLERDEEGLAVCSIYAERMDMCKNFPAAPPIMIESCGYRFCDKWDSNRELGPKEI